MSSAVVSTSAAQSRLFIFDDESAPEVSCQPAPNQIAPPLSRFVRQGGDFDYRTSISEPRQGLSKGPLPSDPRLAHITPASRLAIRPAPEMVASGISALDALTGGLPRGCITEIYGPASSGRTSILLAALSAATRRGECCALIDATDAFDPHSATAASVDLDRLLWVRCGPSLCKGGRLRPPRDPERSEGTRENASQRRRDIENGFFEKNPKSFRSKASEHRLEQVLRTTDLLLESGGFGVIVLDLADVPPESARRIPLTTWFRFRRAIEHTPTILLVIEPQPIAGSCSSLVLQLGVPGTRYAVSGSKPSHSHLLTGLEIIAELIRSRHDRKPAGSVAFETRTAWAG